jgi:predicted negative regulator of RcsB-dependent stress response
VVARKHPKKDTAADLMIDEFESAADRLAGWIAAHAALVIAVVVASLAAAGGYSAWDSWRGGRERDASNALDAVNSEYLEAMGAPPGAWELPELANPEAAKRINAEYAERFRSVAEEYRGTVAARLARLKLGDLLVARGDTAAAIESWRAGAEAAPANSGLRAILLERIAPAEEDAGRWVEAARIHEEAGAIAAFPLRYWSLAEAARCYAAAGETGRALALYQRVEAEAPALRLPAGMRLQRRELRAEAAS